MNEEYTYPKKKGRTKVSDIDPGLIWKLAKINCTLKEMAFITGVNAQTILNHFGDLIDEASATSKGSLRRKQFERAMEGSDRMLIWLGKQWLSQKETPMDTDDDQPLPWED